MKCLLEEKTETGLTEKAQAAPGKTRLGLGWLEPTV
jgi:hypothetical protein